MITRFFISSMLAFLLSVATCSQTKREGLSSEDYHLKNSEETRLIEYKDSDSVLDMKIRQLEVINNSRRRHRAEPLELDILASRLANKISSEAALNNYVGHWNLDGEKPYHRYAFAGGVDHVSENAGGQTTSGQFDNSEDAISGRMEMIHKSFMSERKPNDGHKQTVIQKDHNFAGIGFFANGQQFRYYELYIDRYYEFGDIPPDINAGETFELKCKPQEGRYFSLVIAYYEEEPHPLSPGEISSRSYYNDFSEEIAFQVAPWEILQYRSSDGWYRIPMKFDRPGLYYIHIYSDKRPYKTGTRFSSEGKLQASGLVIRIR